MKVSTAFKTQLQQEGTNNLQETFLEHGAQVIWKIVPLSPTRHLYHKAIITNLGVIAVLLNTQRQNWKKKKYATNERIREISRKRIK